MGVFVQLLTEGYTVGGDTGRAITCVSGLPEGARFVTSHYDILADCVWFVFEHESFAPVPPAEYLPVQIVSFTERMLDTIKWAVVEPGEVIPYKELMQ